MVLPQIFSISVIKHYEKSTKNAFSPVFVCFSLSKDSRNIFKYMLFMAPLLFLNPSYLSTLISNTRSLPGVFTFFLCFSLNFWIQRSSSIHTRSPFPLSFMLSSPFNPLWNAFFFSTVTVYIYILRIFFLLLHFLFIYLLGLLTILITKTQHK